MSRKYKIISGDGHVETPPDFVRFVPEKWKDRAPRLIRLPDGGGDAWLMEGMPLTYASQNLKGRGLVKFAGQSYFDEDGGRAVGAGDGLQRLREQDEDGLDAELLFAPIFASRFLEKIPERDVYLSMVQAYNTWLVEEYCAPAPDRLIANALMPVSGIDDAISELERAHEAGFKSVQLLQFPERGARPQTRGRSVLGESARARHAPVAPHGFRNDHEHGWTPARHVSVAGRSGDDPARSWPSMQHDGAADSAQGVRPDPRTGLLLCGDQRVVVSGPDVLHGSGLP